MRIRTIALGLSAVLALSGCAEYGGYRPAVDTYNDPNAQNLSRDEAECRNLARQASGGSRPADRHRRHRRRTDRRGGWSGHRRGQPAATPARARPSAPRRAASAAAPTRASRPIRSFKTAYRDCMRNRGHNVIN